VAWIVSGFGGFTNGSIQLAILDGEILPTRINGD
jgi:hypothetical protein